MNRKSIFCLRPLAVAVAVVGLLAFAGCEGGGGDSSPITVTPSSGALQTGQSADFIASGASDYHWSMQYEDAGVLSTRAGSTVRFTSTYAGTAPTVHQVLTVVGTIASPNGDYQAARDVYITLTPIGGKEIVPEHRATTPTQLYVTNNIVITNEVTHTNEVVHTNNTNACINVSCDAVWAFVTPHDGQSAPGANDTASQTEAVCSTTPWHSLRKRRSDSPQIAEHPVARSVACYDNDWQQTVPYCAGTAGRSRSTSLCQESTPSAHGVSSESNRFLQQG